MKILAIGDPHGDLGRIRKISTSGVDLILLTGDLGKADLARKRAFENIEREKNGLKKIKEDKNYARDVRMEIHNSTLDVLKYLTKFAPVYTIQGNVGLIYSSDVRENREKYGINLPCTTNLMKKIGVHLEKNKLRLIDGLRVGFLEYYTDVSWVKNFKPSKYEIRMRKAEKQTDRARRVLDRFGNLDILVCHQPPYRVLDKVTAKYAPKGWRGKHAGGKAILDYVKKYQPKYVFCGHIHEGEGKAKIGKSEVYNLGVCGYKIVEI